MSKYTVQDIFQKYGDDYLIKHKASKEQYKFINQLNRCKTKDLGYHIATCESCGETVTGYNSCGDRHCPMCQAHAREKWIKKQNDNLLNIKYFHIITTVPHEFNILFMHNQKIMYDILFKATSESILTLASDKKWLGAKPGITSILHSWGQKMDYHPHIHSIVTGGGLNECNEWITCKKDYLFKVQVLTSLFKQKFMSLLKEEIDNLVFPKELEYITNIQKFNDFLRPFYEKDWVTYIQPPKGSAENVIEYLGRYSFRVAISNERIKSIDNGNITFEYKDYKDDGKIKLITITAEEFIRRFLMHILPPKFTKIKNYGLFTNRSKKINLIICRNKLRKLGYKSYKRKTKRKPYIHKCEVCDNTTFSYKFYFIKRT